VLAALAERRRLERDGGGVVRERIGAAGPREITIDLTSEGGGQVTELRTLIERRLDAITSSIVDDRAGRSAEIARIGDDLRLAIDQAANGHAAQLGELQDRLTRSSPG
jgi:hypothetical protein